MVIGPKPADIPLIRRTLAVYKVSSIITGIFLLGLVVMMVTRYGLGSDIELNGPDGMHEELGEPLMAARVRVAAVRHEA